MEGNQEKGVLFWFVFQIAKERGVIEKCGT